MGKYLGKAYVHIAVVTKLRGEKEIRQVIYYRWKEYPKDPLQWLVDQDIPLEVFEQAAREFKQMQIMEELRLKRPGSLSGEKMTAEERADYLMYIRQIREGDLVEIFSALRSDYSKLEVKEVNQKGVRFEYQTVPWEVLEEEYPVLSTRYYLKPGELVPTIEGLKAVYQPAVGRIYQADLYGDSFIRLKTPCEQRQEYYEDRMDEDGVKWTEDK